MRLRLPPRFQTPLSKRPRIVLPPVLKQCVVRVPLTKPPRVLISWTKNINWMHIRRSEDALDIFWMSYVRSIYVLCPGGTPCPLQQILMKTFEDVFCLPLKKISPRCFAKTLSKRLRNVFKTSWKDVLETCSRPFQDVFKMFSRCIIKMKCFY